MTSRLEQQAKRALLIALTVFVGALVFNINIQGNKQMAFSWASTNNSPYINPDGGTTNEAYNSGGIFAQNANALAVPYEPAAPAQLVDESTGNFVQQTDPYAKWGGQTNYNNLRNNFNTGKNVLFDSLNRAGDSKAREYQSSIDHWLYQDKAAQDAINAKGVNAEMARSQGVSGIRSMVGNGIKSAGVMLANKNAGSSSAAGALANAYGQLGQRQMQSVGNQYGVAQNQIGLEQQNLEGARTLQKKDFENYKLNTVNDIVSSAQQEMSRLNADAANASLPDQIAIQQEVERIRAEAMAKLQQFDNQINTMTQATNREQRMTEAQRLASMDMGGENPFQFTTDNVDRAFQYQGPAGGALPIYTYNNKNKYQA